MNVHEILGMFFLEYLKLKKRSAISVKFKTVLYGTFLNFKAWNTVLDTYDWGEIGKSPSLDFALLNTVTEINFVLLE
jgi:hypothetical protein